MQISKKLQKVASEFVSAAAEVEKSGKGICIHHADIFTGYTQIKKGFILIEGDEVKSVYSLNRYEAYKSRNDYIHVNAEGLTLSPGFIDTHIHGLRGYGVDTGTVEDILGMASVLPEYGVTAFIPTVPVLDEQQTFEVIKAIVEAKRRQTGGARIIGIHLEGPFINPKKKGIHVEEYIREVDLDLFSRFAKASEGLLTSMTVAPELKGMRELVLEAQEQGVVLLAGHSNATYEQMLEGIEAGILHATHFFNAMRSMHHRDPGVVGAILIHPELSCELIADGNHVHPALVEFLVKEKSAGKIVLVTDSLSPTGLPTGIYEVKGDRLHNKDGVFKRVEDDTIAGSALTMNVGIKNMIAYGTDPAEAVNMATLNPARVYNLDDQLGSLLPGKQADLVICDEHLNVAASMIGGKLAFSRKQSS
jgi:N-acetylglucosamine-6-phosphate deacetylase